MTNDRILRAMSVPLVAGLVVLGASCSSDSDTSTPDTTEASVATTGGEVDTPCVADPEAVAARQPTEESTTAELPAELVSELDAAAESSFVLAAAPGAIVGVRTPEGTFIKAYGDADPVAGVAMTDDLHTRIGSVTKIFTGTLIMQLVEQGEVSLDDTIDQYVSDVPNGDRITLRMLANMTSGLKSYTREPAFTDVYFARPETVFTTDEVIDIGLKASPIFEPGTEFDYSNTNTLLLGEVVEEVTGMSVDAALQSMIIEPLGMTGTSWPGESTEMPTPYAEGFTLQGDTATPDNPSNATNWNPAWGGAAGALISNMDDLLVYDRAAGTGQGLLSAETQVARLAEVPGPGGYGIAMGCVDGWVGHAGELPGYNTSVFYDTTTDTSVVVQTNSDIASGACEESPTLVDDPGEAVCASPATRMFVALSAALGHEFTPNTKR